MRTGIDDLLAALSHPTFGGLSRDRCVAASDEFDLREAGESLAVAAENAEDALLVYFAGHGLLDSQGELFLATADTDPRRLRYTALPFEWIRQAMLDTPAAVRIVILDCCFSGRAVTAMADPGAVLSGQIDIAGGYTLTSSAGNRVSHAPAGSRHTAFTGELLALVTTGLSDGPELLTMSEVYRHLLRVLPANGFPKPQQNGTMTAGSAALVRNRAYRPAARRVGSIGTPRRPPLRTMAEISADFAQARMLDESGRHRHAIRLLQELIGSVPAGRGAPSRELLAMRHALARAIGRNGHAEECLRLLGDLEADARWALGPGDAESLAIRHTTAAAAGWLGDRETAETLREALERDARRALAEHDPLVFAIRHDRVCHVSDFGDRAEARALAAALLAEAREALGDDDLLVIRVGRTVAALSPPPVGVDVVRTLRVRAERILGVTHLDALAIRHTEALLIRDAGRPREAVACLEQLRRDAEQALGGHHLLTLDVRHSLGELLGQLGDRHAAARTLVQVVAARERVLGVAHPDSRASRVLLLRYLSASG